jgi:hypothetical protein
MDRCDCYAIKAELRWRICNRKKSRDDLFQCRLLMRRFSGPLLAPVRRTSLAMSCPRGKRSSRRLILVTDIPGRDGAIQRNDRDARCGPLAPGFYAHSELGLSAQRGMILLN